MFVKPGIKVANHYDVFPHIDPRSSLTEGTELNSPYFGIYSFEITAKLAGDKHILRKGTVGRWGSFIMDKAVFLDESLQQERNIHFLALGRDGLIEKLAFSSNEQIGPLVVARGVFKYLQGDYSDERTFQLQDTAEELYAQNFDQGLDSILSSGRSR